MNAHTTGRATLLLSLAIPIQYAFSDIVTTKDGQQRSGKITGRTGDTLSLEVQAEPTLPSVVLKLPTQQIMALQFEPNPALDNFLRSATVTDIDALRTLWERFEGLLKISRTPAPKIGMRYALLLLSSDGFASKQAALNIFLKIASDTTNSSDRDAAHQGVLRALLALGNSENTRAKALEVLKGPCSAPLAAEANLTLGVIYETQYRVFLNENPRWLEDPDIRPERDGLRHKTLDFYLTAALLPEAPLELTQRALLGAFSVHKLSGELPKAAEIARDLHDFYPDSPVAKDADAFLQTLPPTLREALNKPTDEQTVSESTPVSEAELRNTQETRRGSLNKKTNSPQRPQSEFNPSNAATRVDGLANAHTDSITPSTVDSHTKTHDTQNPDSFIDPPTPAPRSRKRSTPSAHQDTPGSLP